MSAIVITLNEERNIERCLSSLSFCDEVVLVDSGSSDGTVASARALGARVFVEEWKGYVGQKLSAIEKTQHDCVLWIDADERVTPPMAEAIAAALGAPSDCAGYAFRRRAMFCGRWMDHAWSNEWVLRLFRKDAVEFAEQSVHESASVRGCVERLPGVLEHYAYERVEDYVTKAQRYAALAAEDLVEKGGRARAWNLIVNPLCQWLKLYVLKRGFLDGWQGYRVSVLSAYYTYLKYAKAMALQRARAKGES